MVRTARSLVALGASLGLAIGGESARADVDQALVDQALKLGFRFVPKDGRSLERIIPHARKQMIVGTLFDFHPIDVEQDVIYANATLGNPHGENLLHVYSPDAPEFHGTQGSAQHEFTVELRPMEAPFSDFDLVWMVDQVSQTIAPGPAKPPQPVRIFAGVLDPFTFSDSSDEAFLAFSEEGLDIPFSLLADTAFPDVFASSPGAFGAIAADTYMKVRFRVAPGVVSDPEEFWSDGLAGAVDLFTLTLQSDELFNVTATLLVGESTGDFLVTEVGTAAAAALIEAAFAGNQGRLLADLEDVFTVGFAPLAGVSEYTVGYRREANLAAWEPIPEASSALLAAVGAAALAAGCAARRQARARARRSQSAGKADRVQSLLLQRTVGA